MSKKLRFNPFPVFQNPHYQAIVNSFFTFSLEPDSKRKLIRLEDGDQLSLEITTPYGWKPTDLTVLLVHGLCGSHRSANLVRMVKRLEPLGIRSVRFNMRGCGSGRGLARKIYHSGRSEDLFYALQAIKKEAPESPIVMVGFSLGGNIALKLAGELGDLGATFLKKVIAVSPPVDLYASILLLGDPANAFYERYFYKHLRADVKYLHKTFKHLPKVNLPRHLKIYEFDQIYTVPFCGFQSAQDYYERCSALYWIPQIEIPCTILLSEDDPIVSPTSLDQIHLPSHIDLVKTEKGGHMGYVGDPKDEKGFYWLDTVLLEWIEAERPTS